MSHHCYQDMFFLLEKRENKLEKERRQKKQFKHREMIRNKRNVCVLSMRIYRIE